MKHFFTAFFLFPAFAFAQDCKLNQTRDQFSKEPKLSTGFASFKTTEGNFLLSIDADAKEIDFFFILENASSKCFTDQSTLTFLFDKNLKVNYKNTGTMNCDGYFHINFKNATNTPPALQRLLTKTINGLSFSGNNKTVTLINLNEDQKKQLALMMNCLVTQSKTLLKPAQP